MGILKGQNPKRNTVRPHTLPKCFPHAIPFRHNEKNRRTLLLPIMDYDKQRMTHCDGSLPRPVLHCPPHLCPCAKGMMKTSSVSLACVSLMFVFVKNMHMKKVQLHRTRAPWMYHMYTKAHEKRRMGFHS